MHGFNTSIQAVRSVLKIIIFLDGLKIFRQSESMTMIDLITCIVLLNQAKQRTNHVPIKAYLDIHFSHRLLGPLDM